jgi:hypothetical protein
LLIYLERNVEILTLNSFILGIPQEEDVDDEITGQHSRALLAPFTIPQFRERVCLLHFPCGCSYFARFFDQQILIP